MCVGRRPFLNPLDSCRWHQDFDRSGKRLANGACPAALLPPGMKRLFDQTRPDRTTVVGHLHGVSFSGKREDAFPSGHALHMGALASAAGALPAGPRRVVRTLAIGLSLTRVAVLGTGASDVVAGFAVGMVLERSLRCLTGFPQGEVHAYPDPKGHTSERR